MMRHMISGEQRHFFSKNGYIEFEDFFTEEKIQTLAEMGTLALGKRLHAPPENLFHCNPDDVLVAGRDIWREDIKIQKQLIFPTLSRVASSLVEETSLRIGFDQLLVFSGKCPKALEKPFSIEEISSIYPLRCACILYLTPAQVTLDSQKFIPTVKTPKSVLFFKTSLPIDWSRVFSQSHSLAWIIAFAAEKAHYRLQKSDPCVHALKKLGYAFGDALSHETHPIYHQTIKNLA